MDAQNESKKDFEAIPEHDKNKYSAIPQGHSYSHYKATPKEADVVLAKLEEKDLEAKVSPLPDDKAEEQIYQPLPHRANSTLPDEAYPEMDKKIKRQRWLIPTVVIILIIVVAIILFLIFS